MIYKCPKSTMLLLCLNYFFLGLAAILWIQFGEENISNNAATILTLIFGVVVFYIVIATMICFGKTISLCKEGCTIQFLFLRKFYPWTYYRTRLYQKAKGRKTVAISIRETLLFLPCRLHKTNSPLLWCQFLYPFSGVCLAFQPPRASKVFEADDTTLSLLQQWGVSIRSTGDG